MPPRKRPAAAAATAAATKEDSNGDKNGHGDNKEEKEEQPPPAKLNKTSSDFGSLSFASEATTASAEGGGGGGKRWNFKISSWNVAGLRACIKKGGLEFLDHEKPDVICFQETKCSEKKLPDEIKNLSAYPHKFWLAAQKEGYSGMGLLSKTKPLKVDYGLGKKEFDDEGRVITAEFPDFFLVTVYVPNAGKKLVTLDKRMEWDPLLRKHLKELDAKKPVVLCGDLNVAHKEVDLANPKTNQKSAGFTPEEREGLTKLLQEGFVDTFRHFYPDKAKAYTFWTYMMNARSKNVGWRLDYFVVSERFVKGSVCDSVIRDQVFGSDHCPSTLFVAV